LKLPRFILAALLATVFAGGLRAQTTPVALFNTSGFNGTETTISFNSLANEVQITNQFSGQGVTFSGGIYAMTNSGDTSQFPSNGGGVIASDWKYSLSSLQSLPITLTFTAIQGQMGFLTEMNTNDVVQITTLLNGVSHGAVSYTSVGLTAVFFGVKDPLGFNSVSITVTGPSNHFLAIDDLRFQAIPEPGVTALLATGLGLTALVGFRRRAG
jgi:hypothetical protein